MVSLKLCHVQNCSVHPRTQTLAFTLILCDSLRWIKFVELKGRLGFQRKSHKACYGAILTELGLECLRNLGDSLLADELLALMQALFSEWTLFTWLAGFSNGSKPLCVRWTLTFLSSGMVSRGLMTESVPWQLRVDIFVTHICQKIRRQEERKANIKVRIKRNPSAITGVQPINDCVLILQILPVFHLSVSQGLFPPCRAMLLPLC